MPLKRESERERERQGDKQRQREREREGEGDLKCAKFLKTKAYSNECLNDQLPNSSRDVASNAKCNRFF